MTGHSKDEEYVSSFWESVEFEMKSALLPPKPHPLVQVDLFETREGTNADTSRDKLQVGTSHTHWYGCPSVGAVRVRVGGSYYFLFCFICLGVRRLKNERNPRIRIFRIFKLSMSCLSLTTKLEPQPLIRLCKLK